MRKLPILCDIFIKSNIAVNSRAFNKYVIFFLTMVIYTAYHMCRKSISAVKPVLHRNCSELNLENAAESCNWAPFDGDNWSSLLGNLDLAFLLSYSIGTYLCGHIAERINIRYFLSIGMFLMGFGTCLLGFGRFLNIHSYSYYLLVQIFCGSMAATGWPSVVTCMGNWFGNQKRGFIMGIWNCQVGFGNILGVLIPGIFITTNWGYSFVIPGLIAVSLSVMTFMVLLPYPEDLNMGYDKIPSEDDFEEISEANLLVSNNEKNEVITFWKALLIPGVIPFSMCFFFAKLVSYTFMFWLPSFIKDYAAFPPNEAVNLSALIDVGGIFGGIVCGLLSDFMSAQAFTCCVMLLLLAPYLYIFLLFSIGSLTIFIVMLIILGILINGPYSLISTAVCADLGTHKSLRGNLQAIATVTAIVNGTGSLGASLGPLLTGLLIPYGWETVFFMLIVSSGLAALMLIPKSIAEVKSYMASK